MSGLARFPVPLSTRIEDCIRREWSLARRYLRKLARSSVIRKDSFLDLRCEFNPQTYLLPHISNIREHWVYIPVYEAIERDENEAEEPEFD